MSATKFRRQSLMSISDFATQVTIEAPLPGAKEIEQRIASHIVLSFPSPNTLSATHNKDRSGKAGGIQCKPLKAAARSLRGLAVSH